MKLTSNEIFLIIKLHKNGRKINEEKIIRKSDKEFDLMIIGKINDGNSSIPCNFKSWLPLSVIHDLSCWVHYANMSDYPGMVELGDWSGIRDSSDETIWNIFNDVIEKKGIQISKNKNIQI